jgi:hypothetical protein
MGLKDIAKSGALGLGASLVAKNPDMLRGMGLVGNIAANKIEDREEEKARRAAEAAAAGQAAPAPGMKKGGKVAGKLATRGYGCVKK